jgi:PAS domain S-box-containing protein
VLQETGLDIPFIVVSGAVGEDAAVALMKAGAHDYVMKDHLVRLAPAVEREIREAHTRRARKDAEEALRESEERFRRLYEISLDGIAIHDGETIIDANEACNRMFGYLSGELIGKRPFDVIAPEARRVVAARIAGRSEDAYDSVGLRKDGTTFPVEFIGKQVVYRGRMLRAAVVRDLTERHRMEERLREAQKFESVGMLAAGIAHEFNNILATVSGNVSLALDALRPHGEVEPLLRSALTSTQRAAGLIRQLLAYAGKGAFVKEAVLVAHVGQEVVQLLRQSTPSNVELRGEFAADLPPVMMDPSHLRQIFINLIHNAAEAIGNADQGVVTVRGSLFAGCVRIEVADTGVGMDEAAARRAFDPFFTTKFLGRGLGLPAVQGIVRSLGGKVALESTVGKGTRVEVLLPAATLPGQTSPKDRHRAVLIVHQDATVRGELAKLLNGRGVRHFEASTPVDAINRVRAHGVEIGVVLLGEAAPGPNEHHGLDAIRALRPDIAIIRKPETEEQLLASVLPALGREIGP